jgi:hypothetical protein
MQLKDAYPSSGSVKLTTLNQVLDTLSNGLRHAAVKPAFPTECYSEAGAGKTPSQTKQQYYERWSDHGRRKISFHGVAAVFQTGGGGERTRTEIA